MIFGYEHLFFLNIIKNPLKFKFKNSLNDFFQEFTNFTLCLCKIKFYVAFNLSLAEET